LVEPLVLGSIIDVDERAIALEARAFSSNSPKTFFRSVNDRRWEQVLRGALLVVAVAVLLLRISWPFIAPILDGGSG
jgi:energy-coupling factor transport system permease protein